MPAPYSDAEQDAILDDLLARVGVLETAVAALETTVGILETNVSDLLSRMGDVETDLGTLLAQNLNARLTALEAIGFPAVEGAVEVLQQDVRVLATRKRQETDPEELSKPQIVLRPSTERVRQPGGKVVTRVVKPR